MSQIILKVKRQAEVAELEALAVDANCLTDTFKRDDGQFSIRVSSSHAGNVAKFVKTVPTVILMEQTQ